MNKKDALADFNEFIRPSIPKNDQPMLDQAWNDYTDMLCKGGSITLHQYETWVHPFN